MNKKTLSVLGVFLFVFLSLSLVSAAIDFFPTTLERTANHNSEINLQFRIYNDYSEVLTDISATLQSLVYGSETIPESNLKLTGLPATIQNETNSSLITLNIKIPEHQAPGIYTGNLEIRGKYTNEVGPYSLPIIITINETESISITETKELTRDQNGTITVKNTGNVDLDDIILSASGDFELEFSDNEISSLAPGESEEITIYSDELDNLDLGANDITITAQSGDVSGTLDISVSGSFCKYGEIEDDLEIIYIKDKKLDNEDAWEWRPLDYIRIEVKLDNNGDKDLDDLIVELVLVDEDGREVSDFAEDEDDLEIDDIEVDENDDKVVEFEFQISSDIEEGNDYLLYAKVYEDGKEDEMCVSLVAEDEDNEEEISIEKKSNNVIVKEVEAPTTVRCDDVVEIITRVYNIGEEDEDMVKVILYNRELGINIQEEIEDLYEGDSEEVVFSFTLPEDVEEKLYQFIVSTEFKYDKDDEIYEKSSDVADDKKISISVVGDCGAITQLLITADLMSDAKVEEDLVVQISITNPGDTASFIIKPSNYETWAEFISVEPSILTIEKGNTEQATIKLKPIKSGLQTFTIDAVYDGKVIEQVVSVNIEEEEKTGFLTGGFTGNLGNIAIYLTAGIFLLLIIIVIVLIVKMARGPKVHSEF